MAQTTEGAKKMVKTIKKKYGKNYFSEIGAEGGRKERSAPRGFAWIKANDPKRFKAIIDAKRIK